MIVPSSPSILLQISPSRLAGCIIVIFLIALYADLENLDLNWESMNAEISCSVYFGFSLTLSVCLILVKVMLLSFFFLNAARNSSVVLDS